MPLLTCAAENAVIATQGLQQSMALFLRYPFNNVLHRHVATALGAIECGSQRLEAFLLQDCRLLEWLAEAPVEVSRDGLVDGPAGPVGCEPPV